MVALATYSYSKRGVALIKEYVKLRACLSKFNLSRFESTVETRSAVTACSIEQFQMRRLRAPPVRWRSRARNASGASFPAETPLLRAVDYIFLPAVLLFAFKLHHCDDYLNARRQLPWAAGSKH